MHENTSHLIFSKLEQNRTHFLLERAIEFSKETEVLFVTNIVNNSTLKKMEQQLTKENQEKLNLKTIATENIDYEFIKKELKNYKFKLLIIDELEDLNIITKIKNNFSITVFVGATVEKDIPSYSLTPNFHEKEELSSITSLISSQLKILKNRFGGNSSDKLKIENNRIYKYVGKFPYN